MAPRILVLPDAASLAPSITYEIGAYSDIHGSVSDAEAPIVAGVWDLSDRDAPTEAYEAEWDEMKYVVRGTATITDELSQQSFELKPGALIWIPKGSKGTFSKSSDFRTIYVEQRHGEGQFQTGSEKEAKDGQTSDGLSHKLAALIETFVAENPSSLEAHGRAEAVLAGGNTRAVLHGSPFPLYIKSGHGPHLSSVDGREYLDLVSDYSAAFYGHSHPVLTDAISHAATQGFSLGAATVRESELAQRVQTRFPSIERVRFCNSGTEANTYALAAAMEFTGRKKILVFDQGYHGGTLSFGSRTNPLNLPHEFVYGTYDSIPDTRPCITPDLAAIIVEPMLAAGGQVAASREFLEFLRQAANVTGAVLIFDEVVTSRLHFHGLQGHHGIRPDMTTLGKYLGGGLPFGAFGGGADIMSLFDPSQNRLAHSGTFNNNVFTMSAALAAADLVTEEEINRVNKLGDNIRDGITALCLSTGVSDLKVTGFGSAVGFHFSGPNAATLKDYFFFHMLQQGIYLGRRGFVYMNLAHTDAHVKQFLEAIDKFLGDIK
ncbi:aminotransferase class-III [Apiospora arundinis]|uniref:Aminotransferase class-III n=1 Tax=Apiospora arundinis TaxID=335852 RepID=A0ABR2IX98_9PEZI